MTCIAHLYLSYSNNQKGIPPIIVEYMKHIFNKWVVTLVQLVNKEILSKTFLNFAEKECKGSSLLYEFLSIKISADDDLLSICSTARERQPIPNLLFGAVHYLLLKGIDHPLKDFYSSIVCNPKSYKDSFEHFKDFCLINRIEILKTKFVQTNEV